MDQSDPDIPNFEIHFKDESLEDAIRGAMTDEVQNAEKSRKVTDAENFQAAANLDFKTAGPSKIPTKIEETERFSRASEEDIKSMMAEASNKNTGKTTSTWLRVFKEWATVKQQTTEIETIPPESLDLVLQQFYAELKKKNGSDYEPESLAVMQASLDRHLREQNYGYSILRDDKFYNSIKFWKAKRLNSDNMGKATDPMRLNHWHGKMRRSCGVLADSETQRLNPYYTQFGFNLPNILDVCQEHKRANVEDFTFGVDENGCEYIMFDESRPTKTRPGGLRKKKRSQIPRMYSTGGERCPVTLFKKFVSRRPKSMLM